MFKASRLSTKADGTVTVTYIWKVAAPDVKPRKRTAMLPIIILVNWGQMAAPGVLE
jgi:hypothetical protein